MDARAQSKLVAAASGAISGGVFLLASAMKTGTLLLFLPFLPLCLVGFAAGFSAFLVSAAAACAVAILPGDLALPSLFAILYAFPAGLIVRQALLVRHSTGEWYPAGNIFSLLTAYATALLVIIGLFYTRDAGSLQGLVLHDIQQALKELPPDLSASLEGVVKHWTFLFLALPIGYWLLLLYAIAWLSHFLLASRGGAIRPSFGLTRFEPPLWLLGALAAAAGLSFMASGDAEFVGKTATVVLLLPYLLSGLAMIHLASHDWPGRWILLTLIYLLLATAIWVTALVAFIGLADHCLAVGKRLTRTA